MGGTSGLEWKRTGYPNHRKQNAASRFQGEPNLTVSLSMKSALTLTVAKRIFFVEVILGDLDVWVADLAQ